MDNHLYHSAFYQQTLNVNKNYHLGHQT